jgi:predicted metal-dependent hydrolase
MNAIVHPRNVRPGKKAERAHAAKNPDVPVRHMNFGFDQAPLPKYFYDNNAFASTFFMAFSAVIPQGERFFIDSVRHYRQHITDPELQARVAGFIGQEAMHGKEHDAANDAYNAMGFPVRAIDRGTRKALALFQKYAPRAVQLSFTVALEHYTAIISEYTISHPEVQDKFAGDIRDFMLWHMMEETEHKAVAFDVYEQTVGSYALRAGTMVPITFGLVAVLFYLQLILLRSDKSQKGILKHLRGAAAVYGPRGLYAGVFPHLLDYFKPGFHPSHHNTDAMLVELRERLLGEQGSIKAKHVKTLRPKRADLTVKALA